MKRWSLMFAAGVVLVALSCSAYAAIGQFEGKWKNIDPNGGLTTLEIRVSGGKVKVHGWGKCQPTDCDWGTVDATAYGPSITSSLPSNAHKLLAVFKEKNKGNEFEEMILVIDPAGRNRLRVEVLTRFVDKSGRSAYSSVHTLSR